MATATAPFGVFLRIPLAEPVLERYQIEAQSYGVSLEQLLGNRLTECVTHNATKPLYFDDAMRRELETVLGKNLDKPATVVALLKKALSVKINGVSVTLTPDVVERLRTRHHVGDFGTWLAELINQELQRYVGLR